MPLAQRDSSCRQPDLGFFAARKRGFSRDVYVFHGDVANFFGSVDHQILLSLIHRQVKDPQYIKLCRTIIHSFSAGSGSDFAGGVDHGRGIPLGNLTSQVFANVYMHEFDYFMKQVCGVHCYARYNDDFYVVSSDKQRLADIALKAKEYLSTRLRLTLPDRKVIIRNVSQGVDILGVVAFPYGLVPRRRLRRASLAVARDAARQGYQSLVGRQLTSYIGLLSYVASYRLRSTLRLSLSTGHNI